MTPYLRWLPPLLLAACIPKQGNPNIADLDGDGIVDARDECLAEPEDRDDFEDEDGCPEKGTASASDTTGATSPTPVRDVETRKRKLRISKEGPLRSERAQASVVPFHKSAWGAVIDDGERGAVVFGFGKAWISAGKRARPVRQHVSRASFSPDGSLVGLVGAKSFLVARVASGKVVSRHRYDRGTEDFPERKIIRVSNDGSAVFYDGCQVFRAGPASKKPEALSARMCGRPLVSDDGKRWFVWLQDESDNEEVQVYQLGLASEEPRLILGGSGDAPGLGQLVLAPDGRTLCFSRHKDGSDLRCRDSESQTETPVWQGPTDRRAIFLSSTQLVFGAGALREQRDLYHVDLDQGALRKLGTLGPKEEWLRAVNETSAVATGGSRLLLFDLQRSTQLSIPLGRGEWEGFARIPGRDREFIIGKERRTTRDLFRATVK